MLGSGSFGTVAAARWAYQQNEGSVVKICRMPNNQALQAAGWEALVSSGQWMLGNLAACQGVMVAQDARGVYMMQVGCPRLLAHLAAGP